MDGHPRQNPAYRPATRSPAPAGLLHAGNAADSRASSLAERLRPGQAELLQRPMEVRRASDRARAGQVDPVRRVPRAVGPRVVVPVEYSHRRAPLLPRGVDRVVDVDVLLADGVEGEPDHVVDAALPERLQDDPDAVAVGPGVVV